MIKKNSIAYNDILNMWLDNKSNLKIQSKLNYEYLINKYIKNSIGIISITKINKNDINNFIYSLKNEVAISTQKKLIYIIKSSLIYAYHNKYCNYIDLNNIKFNKEKQNIFILSKEEQYLLEMT